MGGHSDVAGVVMVLLLVLVSASPVWACTITTTIKDADGNPVTQVVVGTTVHDTAVLEDGTPYCHNPSGPTPYHCHTVTYMRYNTDDCRGSHVDETVTVTETGVVLDSGPFTPTSAGSYSYKAVYKDYGGSTIAQSACEHLTVMPACASPAYGTAQVDGNYDEWDLTEDFFAGMYRGWKYDENHPLESRLYLRYDCASGVLYVLVLAEPGVTIRAGEPGESWVKIKELQPEKRVDGNSGDDGVPPDFAWIGKSGSTAAGWEASFYLGQGTFHIIVHTNVNHAGSQTSGTLGDGLCLVISCPLGSSIVTMVHVDGATLPHAVVPLDGSVPLGTSVHDNATVTGQVGGPAVTGTVTYNFFKNGGCTGTPFSSSPPVSVGSESPSTGQLAAGSYSYNATYSGDGNYLPSKSACEPFSVGKADTSTVTAIFVPPDTANVTDTTQPLGTVIQDKAIVSGQVNGLAVGGTVDFRFYTTSDCTGPSSDELGVSLVDGVALSSTHGPLAAGSYSFKAHYNGDGVNYSPSDSVCEPIRIGKADTSTVTEVHLDGTVLPHTVVPLDGSVPLGTSVHDNATVGPKVDGFTIGGTVTYNFFKNGGCTGTPFSSSTVGVGSESSSTGALAAGSYSYNATYSGDGNYLPSKSACEPFSVVEGRIVVAKVTIPPGQSQSFDFSTTGAGYLGFSLSDGQSNDQTLAPGQYSVNETLPNGWALQGLTCVVTPSGGSSSWTQDAIHPTNVTINLAAGETVTCTYTDEKSGGQPLGTIVVEKQTIPSDDPATFEFTGTANGVISDNGLITVTNLPPENYTSTELVPPGWELTSIVCNDTGSSYDLGTATATFDLDAGETVKCTFTDTKLGTIVVEKQTIPPNDPQQFTFTGDAADAIGDNGQIIVGGLLPGTYDSTEEVPVNWQLIEIACNDTSSANPSSGDLASGKATFHVEAGEVVKCTFTDTDPSKLGTIVVEKQTIPPNDPQQFTFTGDAADAIGDNGQIIVANLLPGTYTSTESVPAGWKLVDIVCNDASSANPSSGDVGTGKATFHLEAGEVVKCTFTDEKPSGPPPPPPVGGELYSVDKSALVQPYVGLLGLLGAVAAAFAIRRRREA